MPLVPMRLLLDHAAENNYGLAAFNVNNMEQIQSIMEAARETESPVMISHEFHERSKAIAERRLVAAGYRLAERLNRAFGR